MCKKLWLNVGVDFLHNIHPYFHPLLSENPQTMNQQREVYVSQESILRCQGKIILFHFSFLKLPYCPINNALLKQKKESEGNGNRGKIPILMGEIQQEFLKKFNQLSQTNLAAET